ncbi:MAG: SEC-C domain-containing protein [Melioribacteraceae bacterium]|nr:SEC-C domain-containing protein [Melioribacteraceae bacterium]
MLKSGNVIFGVVLDFNQTKITDVDFFEIQPNEIPGNEIEKAEKELPKFYSRMKDKFLLDSRKRKVGRNDTCPCGSGKKI